VVTLVARGGGGGGGVRGKGKGVGRFEKKIKR
jgi:hypothetical protein